MQTVVHRVAAWINDIWNMIFDRFRGGGGWGGGMWFMDLFNYDETPSSASWTPSLSLDLGNTAASSTPSTR